MITAEPIDRSIIERIVRQVVISQTQGDGSRADGAYAPELVVSISAVAGVSISATSLATSA